MDECGACSTVLLFVKNNKTAIHVFSIILMCGNWFILGSGSKYLLKALWKSFLWWESPKRHLTGSIRKNIQYPINENKSSEYIVIVEKHVEKVAYLNCYCFEQGFEQFSLYFRIFFFGVKILRYTSESIRNEKQLLINTKFNIFAVQYWASSEIWLLRARVWPKSKRIWQILNISYWILKFQGTLEMVMQYAIHTKACYEQRKLF